MNFYTFSGKIYHMLRKYKTKIHNNCDLIGTHIIFVVYYEIFVFINIKYHIFNFKGIFWMFIENQMLWLDIFIKL